jgi:uncharacterized membrane protein
MVTARNFFDKEQQQMLVNAIVSAELKTSGEIRLHLNNICFGNELKAAQKVFKKLSMHNTNERNGVLIYVSVLSRKIAVFGDEGIYQKLGNSYWQSVILKFKQNKKAEALSDCIVELGEQLGKYFPRNSNDVNELPNTISY